MKKLLTVLTVGLLLSGCSAGSSAVRGEDSSTDGDLLGRHQIETADAETIIDELDNMPLDERDGQLMASVRYDKLLLSDSEEEIALDIPDGKFYLSLAPYQDATHECFYHSLTTCTGEMSEETFDVTISDGDGDIIFEGERTSQPNGFIGFWLPRDTVGTIEISNDDASVKTEFATGSSDPTCLTEIKLS